MSKFKFVTFIFIAIFSLFSQNVFAQQNNDEGLDQVCSLASGKWHTAASGWACCWSNWGCYGCTGGNCVMKCETTRCRKANGMSRMAGDKSLKEYAVLRDLAPQGAKAPVIPRPHGKTRPVKEDTMRNKNRNNYKNNNNTKRYNNETHQSGEMEDHH